jgi:hypothetical protein
MRLALLLPLLLVACAADDAPPPTPLAVVTHEGLVLPEADMARPIAPEHLERMLVVRVGRDGFLSAVRLSDGTTFPVADLNALGKLLWREAEAAGLEEEPPCSTRLGVLVAADGQAAWGRLVDVTGEAAAPECRVRRLWIAARDLGGSVTALPLFIHTNADRGNDGFADVEHEVRVGTSPRESAVEDREALRRRMHALWRRTHGQRVHVRLTADPDVPVAAAAAVINEARRLGFGLSVSTLNSRRPGASSGAAWFVLPVVTEEELVAVPPLRPGVALAGDPAAAPFYVTEIPAIEQTEPIEEAPTDR